jgi:hypothetical protein
VRRALFPETEQKTASKRSTKTGKLTVKPPVVVAENSNEEAFNEVNPLT